MARMSFKNKLLEFNQKFHCILFEVYIMFLLLKIWNIDIDIYVFWRKKNILLKHTCASRPFIMRIIRRYSLSI